MVVSVFTKSPFVFVGSVLNTFLIYKSDVSSKLKVAALRTLVFVTPSLTILAVNLTPLSPLIGTPAAKVLEVPSRSVPSKTTAPSWIYQIAANVPVTEGPKPPPKLVAVVLFRPSDIFLLPLPPATDCVSCRTGPSATAVIFPA